MDARAKKLIDMVLKHEGGYVNDKDDAGGETYRGITRKNFSTWKGWSIIDANKPLKHNQIIKNTQLEDYVREFYYQQFYLKMKVDRIKSECIAGHVFCHGVNAGITSGVRLLQKAINKVYGINITVDGKIGPTTLSYADGEKSAQVANALIDERNQYYKNIVARKPSQKKFLNGWLNRVKGTTQTCCAQSHNVFLTLFTVGNILEKVLGFIFDVIKLFTK